MSQDVRNEPPRLALGPGCEGGIFNRDFKDPVREPDGAGDPVGHSPAPCQASIPVEACRPVLYSRSDVTEPKRPPGAMAEQMDAQQAEMVFRRQDPHLLFTKRHNL
jgi:hypothetical protein